MYSGQSNSERMRDMFGEKILDYWDDIVRDLGKLVAIPSVAVPTEGEHPFGDPCAKALDTAVELAESYGLKAKNVDYYAAHAEIGEGEGNAVVMAHLDVVPAGEGWDSDPFTMVPGHWPGRGGRQGRGCGGPALPSGHKGRGSKGQAQAPGYIRLRRGDRYARYALLLLKGAAPGYGLHPGRGLRHLPL